MKYLSLILALEAALRLLPNTPLADGIAATIAMFKQAIAAGRI